MKLAETMLVLDIVRIQGAIEFSHIVEADRESVSAAIAAPTVNIGSLAQPRE